MNWIVYALNLALFAVILRYFYRHYTSIRKYVLPAALVKVLAGIGMGVLYKYYYHSGDTFAYFNEAESLVQLAQTNFFDYFRYIFISSSDIFDSSFSHQPRALLLVKITSVVNLFTYENYWLSSVYFSLFSFAGTCYLVKILAEFYPKHMGAIAFSFFFFPSAIFWSSGIIKESIAMGCIGFVFGLALNILKNQKISWYQLLGLLLTSALLWNIKYYYAGAIILILISMAATYYLSIKIDKPKWFLFISFIGFSILMALLVTMLHPNFYLNRVLAVIVKNYNEFVSISDAGDYVVFFNLNASWSSLLINSPWALCSGLFRPMIGESTEFFKILVGFEHLLLLMMAGYSFSKIPKEMSNRDFILLLGALSFVMIMAIFLTLSAPNFGSLLRYKSGFMPFFIFIITVNNPYVEKLMQRLFRSA